MTNFEALFMGVLQGLTEYLPVSSSGHLAIASNYFGIDGESNLTFTITVHVATVLSTLVILYKEIAWIFKGLCRPVGPNGINKEQKYALNILVSMIPVGIVGVFFKDYVEVSPESGVIAASIEEYMYFKRTNWQIHRVRFYYQLVFTVSDGKFDVMMRRLHYRYDPEVTAGDFDDDRRAENWITDDAALTKNGTRLARISGKFRTHTIDRKNEIFKQAALATGAKVKKMKWVEVEE